MGKFISCDWGTSVLKLRLIDTDNISVLAELISEQGVSVTFDSWKRSDKKDERLAFYQSILEEQIKVLEKQSHSSLQDMPLIISGMASSSISVMELPYKELPFGIDGQELNVKTIEETDNFKHNAWIISGAKINDDAMRGEETQLIGCLGDSDLEDQLIIFPGTHSKQVRVNKGKAEDIKTYMTGEFFELLSQKSILSNNVEKPNEAFNENNLKIFEQGVADSLHSNILHNVFLVRTKNLFGKITKHENYWRLSGLLVGYELKELINIQIPITIVGDELRIKLYSSALKIFGKPTIKYYDTGKAVLKGHYKIYNLYKSKLHTGTTFIQQ